MKRNWRRFVAVWLLMAGLLWATAVQAQESESLRLSLSRDFGASTGSGIQGRFSYRVEGPDNLIRVEFYLDDQIIGEDEEPPFRYQFQTDNYENGLHTLYAVGFLADGSERRSNEIRRNFISGSEATRSALWLIVPLLILIIGGRLVSSWIANRGRKTTGTRNVHGPFGGTICPKCNKPFAMHIWGLNILVGKFDRCPHCGKWSVVRRVHPDVLDAAVEAMLNADVQADKATPPADEGDSDDDLRKRLDDSRFDQ